jgi:hypothetical protein
MTDLPALAKRDPGHQTKGVTLEVYMKNKLKANKDHYTTCISCPYYGMDNPEFCDRESTPAFEIILIEEVRRVYRLRPPDCHHLTNRMGYVQNRIGGEAAMADRPAYEIIN